MEQVWTTPADVILLGHTHVAMARTAGSRLILNPGSCGEVRDVNSQLSFAELDFGSSRATIYRIERGAEPYPLMTRAF